MTIKLKAISMSREHLFLCLLVLPWCTSLRLSSPMSRTFKTPTRASVVTSSSSFSSLEGCGSDWSPGSWRTMPVKQTVEYPDVAALEKTETELRGVSPLVFAGEVRDLQAQLAKATMGQGFVIMGGDCAESFEDFHVDKVRDTFRVVLQMALILTYGSSMPVIKIGRMAGQFAKPRSSDTEFVDGVGELPSYRGDNINRDLPNAEARKPDPQLMLEGYHQSAQTLNILRAFSTGGFADISRLHAWNLDFVERSAPGSKYRILASKVDEALRFMQAIGVDVSSSTFTECDFFTAHECLLLPYEEALTRIDSISGKYYDCSAHMVWIGERTRQLDCAHVEFCRGVNNPIGIKVSDKCEPAQLVELVEKLNPTNVPGRIVIIVRMGAEKVRDCLPDLIREIMTTGKNVLWVSDPVHGNTVKTQSGHKTRDFKAIRAELRAFFDVHDAMGTHPGGFHVEMTGDDVTECLGGLVDITEEDLAKRYTTHCDPRLNGEQAIELAFLVAERMRKRMDLPPLIDSDLDLAQSQVTSKEEHEKVRR